MFDTLIVQPIFNLLVAIYGVLPGHDFGLAVILFTIVIRMLMWPMVKKQLHNTKVLRAMQPEIKKIRAANKGDKQAEAAQMMELYKERGVSPFSTLGTLLIQLPVLFGLFSAIRKLIDDQSVIETFSYGFVRDLPFIQSVIESPELFEKTLLGIVDLSRQAIGGEGGVYIPLLLMALISGVLQYYQAKQLSPDSGEQRKLRDILKESADGKEADQAEINAAMARNTRVIFPAIATFFAATFPGSLALYWVTGSVIAITQHRFVLNQDVEEMESLANTVPSKRGAKKDRVKVTSRVVSEDTKATTNKESGTKKKSSSKKSNKSGKKKGKK